MGLEVETWRADVEVKAQDGVVWSEVLEKGGLSQKVERATCLVNGWGNSRKETWGLVLQIVC